MGCKDFIDDMAGHLQSSGRELIRMNIKLISLREIVKYICRTEDWDLMTRLKKDISMTMRL